MSWEEVGKINSDYTREPLNFNNYINDISTFGKYSYVLDPENSKLWRSMLSQSLVMFGHSAIHDTVYERLTDEDVDYMLRHNTRLGQAFNSFYSVGDFTSGRIDSVLSAITYASYNVLDLKFQSGINRYVSEKTSGNTAGEWLGTVFGIASLKSKTTMASIISDTTLWNNTVTVNESLRFVICLSVSAAEYMASHSNSSNYVSFIETVAQSTDATMTLINALAATAQLDTFFANESVCNAIANSAPSMTAICYNTDGFAAMIASETAMTIVAASETAVNVIMDGITNAANSETVLDGIKSDLTSIEESLPSIANTEVVIAEVAGVKENISGVVTSLQKVTSQSDVLITNIDRLLNNKQFLSVALSNDSVFKKLADSSLNGKVATAALSVGAGTVISDSKPSAYTGRNIIVGKTGQTAGGIDNVWAKFYNPEVRQFMYFHLFENPEMYVNKMFYNFSYVPESGNCSDNYALIMTGRAF